MLRVMNNKNCDITCKTKYNWENYFDNIKIIELIMLKGWS